MPEKPPASVQVERIRARIERENVELGALTSALGDLKELGVEFMRTAVSNPATGFVLAMVTTDVLYRMKVIDQGTALAIFGALLAAFAVDITVEATGALSFLFGSSSTAGGNVDLIKPVTQTVVQSPSASSQNAGMVGRLLSLIRPGAGTGDIAAAAETAAVA